MSAKKFTGWLASFQTSLQREIAAIEAMGRDLVEIDIKRRARDRRLGKRYARHRNRLIQELDKQGISEAEFCGSLGRGQSLSMMYRRMKLVPDDAWARYLANRRARGDDGHFDLPYAVFLAQDTTATRSQPLRTPSATESVSATTEGDDDPDHEVICGYAQEVLRGRADTSVHVVVTSPPYWPARRLYIPDDLDQIGLEPKLETYLERMMETFGEVHRVLRDDGVCWIVLDDAISERPYRYSVQSYNFLGQPKDPRHFQVLTQDTA
jgi:hypothetical protein